MSNFELILEFKTSYLDDIVLEIKETYWTDKNTLTENSQALYDNIRADLNKFIIHGDTFDSFDDKLQDMLLFDSENAIKLTLRELRVDIVDDDKLFEFDTINVEIVDKDTGQTKLDVIESEGESESENYLSDDIVEYLLSLNYLS